MSTHTFTPRPWKQGTGRIGNHCVFVDGPATLERWIDCITTDNARLIAAAPKLLAIVERSARAFYDAGYTPAAGSSNPMEALYADALAAIAEVAGRTP